MDSTLHNKKFGMGALAPLPRFVFFCVISLASTFFTYSWKGVIISGIFVSFIYLLGRSYNKLGIITSTVAGTLSFLGNIFIHHSGEIFLVLGPLTLTTGGLEKGAILGIRLFFMILFAFAYIGVTSLEEIFDTAKSLKLPLKGQIYLMIVLRYIDLLNKEFTTLMQSMTIRGINWNGSILEKIKGLRLIPVPMIFRLIGHINQQSLALDNLGGVSSSKKKLYSNNNNKVEITNSSVTYNLGKEISEKDLVLKNININFYKGERVMLVGENGSGKSSALILARGLISRTIGQNTGSIRIFGNEVKKMSTEDLAHLTRIVFPSAAHGLIGIRIKDELELSLLRSKIHKSKWDEHKIKILNLIGLDETFLNRKTLSLSGGQQQRVAIASALISEPELLIFDEVTGQLDPIGKEEVMDSIKKINLDQSIMISESNLNPLDFDKILLVKDKNVIELDKKEENFFNNLDKTGRRMPFLQTLINKYPNKKIKNDINYVLKELNNLILNDVRILNLINPQRNRNSNNKNEIIEIKNVYFSYDKINNALSNINLNFKENELTAILGANGSGKSTLGLIMSKALKPNKGKILKDKNIKIGYIFQESSYQILATKVGEEIAFGPKQLKIPTNKINNIVNRECKRFNLNKNDNPINLAPEELRKLTIASILAIDSDIIIFDEPTNTLDENEINDLMVIISNLKKQGKTIILITHDIQLAWKYAERLIVMKNGNIIIDDKTDEVMKNEKLLRSCNVSVPDIAKLYNASLKIKN